MLGLAIMSCLEEPKMTASENTFIAEKIIRKCHLCLIERNGLRNKADRILRELSYSFDRIRMDIRNCAIPYLPSLGTKNDIILTAKHLCGLATDLSIYSVQQHISKDSLLVDSKFKGMAIATCCHHACSWGDYVGLEWLSETCDISESEFELMKKWSGWAHTLKFPEKDSADDSIKSSKRVKVDNDLKDECSDIEDNVDNHAICEHSIPTDTLEGFPRPKDLSREEMAGVGKMVKRVLDQGRVEYLRRIGMNAFQVRYCPSVLSPECFVIVARNQHDQFKILQGKSDESNII
jgi:tRNA:m4X modification enzyme